MEKIADLETDRQEKEHIRMKEMEMLMQLRQKLDAAEEQINSMQVQILILISVSDPGKNITDPDHT